MAVSLTQMSQDHFNNRPRAQSGANGVPYFHDSATYMPVPEDFHQQSQFPPPPPHPPQHFGTYGYRPPMPQYNPYIYQQQQHYHAAQQWQSHAPSHPPAYSSVVHAPVPEQAPPVPPRPPKTPIEQMPDFSNMQQQGAPGRPHSNSILSQTTSLDSNSLATPDTSTGRPHSDSQVSTISSTIEPDPLPPHSNPQALTQSQSAAFEDSCPIPPVRLGKDEVWDSRSGFAMFLITREAAHMPSFLSTKPLLTVTRLSTNVPMGHIKFHSMLSSDIELTINGRETTISHSILHNRWAFRSTTCPNQDEKWYWSKDKKTGGAKLEDNKKKGRVLAKMKGDLLTFEAGRMSDSNYEEILLSAVAMAEAARRASKGNVTDLASSIGELASSAGHHAGHGGGGS
ncbi:hypothetical protein HII31_06456 [Pseudocercospora fuligena]|uniref:Uncharacterized protein n=1 Tax=Pseudocercospora fuligena TaxID=685502 RepID=A0A8H6RJZ9_9PEZI|nr:hypothetical protein HII31_06456 [Pseudocercospora fuligena]